MRSKAHILYLFVNFPLIWFCKIGITRKSAKGRAKQVDRAAPGTPRVAFILVAPLIAYQLEQLIHWVIDGLNWRYYRGDGSTEWFIFPAHFVAFAFMATGWMGWWALIVYILSII